MTLDDALFVIVEWNSLLLILGGCIAASWLLIRLASVTDSDEISSLTEKIALLGFPIGILSLVLIGGAFYLFSFHEIGLPSSFDFFTLVCLLILGLALFFL